MSEYHMSHRPAGREYGAPLWDLTQIYPSDVYSLRGLRFYGGGADIDRYAYQVIKSVRGQPDAKVKIYRAVPRGVTTINSGDWVTIVKEYAYMHAINDDDPINDDDVISMEVAADDIFTDGNSWLEWGYHPKNSERQNPTDSHNDLVYLYHVIIGDNVDAFLKNPSPLFSFTHAHIQASHHALNQLLGLSDQELAVLYKSTYGKERLKQIFETIVSVNSTPYKGRVYGFSSYEQAFEYGKLSTNVRTPGSHRYLICKIGPYAPTEILPDEDLIAAPFCRFSKCDPLVAFICESIDNCESLLALQEAVFERIKHSRLGDLRAQVKPNLAMLLDKSNLSAHTFLELLESAISSNLSNAQLIDRYLSANSHSGASHIAPYLKFDQSSGYAPIGKLMLTYLESPEGSDLLDKYRSLLRICAASVPDYAPVDSYSLIEDGHISSSRRIN